MGSEGKAALSFGPGSGQNQAANSDGGQTPPTVTPQPEGKQPEYITRDEFNQKLNDVLDQANRNAQGWADKTASRIEQRVNQIVTDYRNVTGQAPPQEFVNRAKQVATQEAGQSGESNANNQGSPDQAQTQGNQQPAQDDVMNKTAAIYQKYGTVEPDDPEASLVDFSNEQAFLSSLEKAAQAKQKRISGSNQQPGSSADGQPPSNQQQPPANNNQQANSGAGFQFVGGNGLANAVQSTNDLDTLWKIAKQQGRI